MKSKIIMINEVSTKDNFEYFAFNDNDVSFLDGSVIDIETMYDEELDEYKFKFLELLDEYGSIQINKEESSFVVTGDWKKEYFNERYELFQQAAANLTFEEFVGDSDKPYKVQELIELADNDEDDLTIYLNGSAYYNLDYFVKNAKKNTTYYLGTIGDVIY